MSSPDILVTDNPQQFTRLEEWLAWLEQAHSIHKIELGLERVSSVARAMGLLEPSAKVITVAGTNGKGSTVAAVESLAISHKLSVGSYTSPHLISFNERIKLEGENCSDDLICKGFEAVYQAKKDIELTYFELTTLVALWIFKQQAVDLIVLEVGLGGRLDAVNILDADIAVVTSIGLDHEDWLGSDLKQIAGEKAGVARANKPLIIADDSTESLLLPHCGTIGCTPWSAQSDYQVKVDKKYWSYSSEHLSLDFYELPLSDLHLQNLAAGLTAFTYCYQELLNKDISYASTYKAFENLSVVGRFQTLSSSPLVIVDVAHNPDSAELLNSKLKKLKETGVERIIGLCGMLKDKDAGASLEKLTEIGQWNLLDLPEPRGKKASELLQCLPELSQNNVKCYASLSEFNEACQQQSCLSSSDALAVLDLSLQLGCLLSSGTKKVLCGYKAKTSFSRCLCHPGVSGIFSANDS